MIRGGAGARKAGVVAACAVATIASICQAAQDPAPLTVVDRLVSGPFLGSRGKRIAAAAPVILNDVAMPVPLRAEVRAARARCAPEQPPDAHCPVEILHLGKSRLALLETRPWIEPETFAAVADRVQGPLFINPVRVFRAPRKGDETLRVPRYESTAMRALLASPMRKQWIESRELDIAEGSELQFSIGVEEPAWHVDTAPVDFIVRAYTGEGAGGTPVEIFRATLDPARNPDQRGWRDHRVSLDEMAGQTVRLRFETLPNRRRDRRPQLPVWGNPTVLAPQPPALANRPWVVLVSLDTLRARSLSALGNELETSPFFDQLTTEGTLFERAFTTYSNTLGSHMSMLTGLWPRTHGVISREPLSRRKYTLAERMRKAGFETAAFTENALLDGQKGFQRGFGRYSENKEIAAGAGAARTTFDAALDWARAHREIPFFLFVHTYQVHYPYVPAEPYSTLYDPEAHPREDLRRYEQEIRYLDDELRRLVDQLDAIVGAENLLLVITADHGEEFGEHGMTLHSQLFDEVMHVPLLFRYPPVVPAGLRVDTPVSLVDITPTILELAGAKHFRARDGRTLTPAFRDDGALDEAVIYGEVAGTQLETNPQGFVARTATHKCLVRAGWEQGFCFDLVNDPEERRKLPPETSAQTSALHEAVLEYRDSGEPSASTESEQVPRDEKIDPKRSEKLRALGYVQ